MGAGRGRYAPSPTGAIHLGNARTALIAWLDARHAGDSFVLRVEDLDRARIPEGAEARMLEDLRWLGLDWDEGPDVGGPWGPYRQSERTSLYDQLLEAMLGSGHAFLCACSRADVARAASAPHAEDDEGPRYPGTCRDLPRAEVEARAAAQGRRPSVRFRGGAREVAVDELHGALFPVAGGVDDFVLRRADGTASYQFAVVVDDATMGIERVVRGADLLGSTLRQVALYKAMKLPMPKFAHVPLVLAPGGERLAKRTRPVSIADLRARGVSPERVVGVLAASAGLCPKGIRREPRHLKASFELWRVGRDPVVVDGEQLTPESP
jgi:glutamyl-tRNA synthetase